MELKLISDMEISDIPGTFTLTGGRNVAKAQLASDSKAVEELEAEITELKQSQCTGLFDCNAPDKDKYFQSVAAVRAEVAREIFKALENYQVTIPRNGSKIIYGANFDAVKSKYLEPEKDDDK